MVVLVEELNRFLFKLLKVSSLEPKAYMDVLQNMSSYHSLHLFLCFTTIVSNLILEARVVEVEMES